jgi:hypothetical protein
MIVLKTSMSADQRTVSLCPDDREGIIIFYLLARLYEDVLHNAAGRREHRNFHFHGFQNDQRVAFIHRGTCLDFNAEHDRVDL